MLLSWIGCLLMLACSSRSSSTSSAMGDKEPSGIAVNADSTTLYHSENLIIKQVAANTYVHTSYLNTEDFGKVPCNGMVVLSDGECLIFDTPADEIGTEELLNFLINDNMLHINGIIATHFHADCVAGLNVFHRRGIPSYAHERTIALLQKKADNSYDLPQHTFQDQLELTVGTQKTLASFLGEGHTKDNVIGYFPKDKVLFGGCLIKEDGAGKGNLEDANVQAWPETVGKLRQQYPQIKLVIPGHGAIGGTELLDYTIKLFASSPQ